MKLGVITWVYPGCAPFLPELWAGLAAQTDTDFTLLIVEDGLHPDAPERAHRLTARGTPAELRAAGIRWAAAHHVDALVFIDGDDVPTANRVATCRHGLNNAALVCTDLYPFTDRRERRPWLAGRMEASQPIPLELMRRANVCGLTNTAAHLSALLPHLGDIPGDTVAFDWALFTRVLEAGATSSFRPDAATWYRLHGQNTVGAGRTDDQSITRAATIKRAHYEALVNQHPRVYRPLADHFGALCIRLELDDAFRTRYCEAARTPGPNADALWWEIARPFTEELAQP